MTFAIKGFFVAETDVEAMPGGSLKLAPPHAIVKQLKVKIENSKNGRSGASFFIVYLSPSGMEAVAGETLTRKHQDVEIARDHNLKTQNAK